MFPLLQQLPSSTATNLSQDTTTSGRKTPFSSLELETTSTTMTSKNSSNEMLVDPSTPPAFGLNPTMRWTSSPFEPNENKQVNRKQGAVMSKDEVPELTSDGPFEEFMMMFVIDCESAFQLSFLMTQHRMKLNDMHVSMTRIHFKYYKGSL